MKEVEKSPLVSVIIPSFNREKLIGETLRSVLDQTYCNWECIIVDDGSTDGTIDVVQSFVKKDDRFRLFTRHREPKGAPTCRNIGIDKSEGEYIIFLDSDDLFSPTCLKARVSTINEYPNLDFLVFQILGFKNSPGDFNLLWNKFDLGTYKNDLHRFLVGDTPWATPSAIWKKQAIKSLGGWSVDAKNWQDWEVHIRAILAGLNYKKIDQEPDCFFRCDHSEISISKGEVEYVNLCSRLNTLEKITKLVLLKKHPFHAKWACALQYFRICTALIKAGHYYQTNWNKVNEYKLLSYPWYLFWAFYLRFRFFENEQLENPIKKIMDQIVYFHDRTHFWDRPTTFKKLFVQ